MFCFQAGGKAAGAKKGAGGRKVGVMKAGVKKVKVAKKAGAQKVKVAKKAGGAGKKGPMAAKGKAKVRSTSLVIILDLYDINLILFRRLGWEPSPRRLLRKLPALPRRGAARLGKPRSRGVIFLSALQILSN